MPVPNNFMESFLNDDRFKKKEENPNILNKNMESGLKEYKEYKNKKMNESLINKITSDEIIEKKTIKSEPKKEIKRLEDNISADELLKEAEKIMKSQKLYGHRNLLIRGDKDGTHRTGGDDLV